MLAIAILFFLFPGKNGKNKETKKKKPNTKMKISESELKRIIKEEIQEISLGVSDEASNKAEKQGGIYYDLDEEDPQSLTVSDLMGWLMKGGPKGQEMAAQLKNILKHAVRISERNTNIQINNLDKLDAITNSMCQKIIHMNYPSRKYPYTSPEATQERLAFWTAMNKAIEDQDGNAMPVAAAKQQFGLTDDEAYAYKKMID